MSNQEFIKRVVKNCETIRKMNASEEVKKALYEVYFTEMEKERGIKSYV